MKPMTEEQAEQWKNTRDKGLLNEAFKLFLTSFFILFLVGAAWQSMTKGFESLEWWSMLRYSFQTSLVVTLTYTFFHEITYLEHRLQRLESRLPGE